MVDHIFWLYLAVGIPYTLFVILYATRSPWYRTGMGRSLLLSKSVIAALVWNALLGMLFGEFPGRPALRVFIIGGAIVAGWTQLFLLLKEQRAARRCPRDHPRRRATDRHI